MVLRDVDTTARSGTRYMVGVSADYLMAELETENARLKQLVAELLIKNHELREICMGPERSPGQQPPAETLQRE
jgi:hypothetical protein